VTETRISFCRSCHNGCGIEVQVEDERAVHVTGDRQCSLSGGFTCMKGRALPSMLNHPDRVLRSVKRNAHGALDPLESERAMDEIAERIRNIVDRWGPRAIAVYAGTHAYSNVLTLSFAAAFLKALGSPMMFTPATIDKPGKKIADAMHGKWQAPAQGWDRPEVALLVGINPPISFEGAPGARPGQWLKRMVAEGMELIVVDPRRSATARMATLHLQPAPGHDVEILAAIIRLLLDEGSFDREFVAENACGLERLRRAVEPFTPAAAARAAGIEADDLLRAARIFGAARRGDFQVGTAPHFSGSGVLVEYLGLDLLTLSGFWQREGERVNVPPTLKPAPEARAQAAPPVPAYGFGERMRVRGLANTAAGLPTAALSDEILLPGDGQVRALISCGGNPVAAWPDQLKAIEAMRSLELLVQVDPWMSQTAKLADYVIAPTMSLEEPSYSVITDLGTPHVGADHPWAQYTPAVVGRPPGSDLLEMWEFFHGLAARLDIELAIDSVFGTPVEGVTLKPGVKPTSDELLVRVSEGARIPLAEVKRHPHGLVANEPSVYVAPKAAGWTGRLELADQDMMRDLAAVAARLDAPPASVAAHEYPFRLVCRRVLHMNNSTLNDSSTNRGKGYNPAFMNPLDLDAHGIAAGDEIVISSRWSTILAIAEPDDDLLRGLVSITHGYGGEPREDHRVREIGSPVGRLMTAESDYDRYSGQPLMSNLPVKISLASASAPGSAE
jgi:anaerobic selenocysteine-containing dehydrogenase